MQERFEDRLSRKPFDRRHFLKTLGGAAGSLIIASVLPEMANSSPLTPLESPKTNILDKLLAISFRRTERSERIGTTQSPYFTENGSRIDWSNGWPGIPPNPSTRGYGQVWENGGNMWQVDSTLKKPDGTNLYRLNSHVNIAGIASAKKTNNSEVAIYATADSPGDGSGKIRVQGKDVGSGSQYAFPTDGLIDTDFTGDPVQGLEVNEVTAQKYVVLTYTGGVKKYIKLGSDLRAAENSWTDTPPVIDPTSTPTPTPTPTSTTIEDPKCKNLTGEVSTKKPNPQPSRKVTVQAKFSYAPGCQPNGRVILENRFNFGVPGTTTDEFTKNGRPGKNVKASFTYSGAGRYTVRVDSRDNRGQSGFAETIVDTPLLQRDYITPSPLKPKITFTLTPTPTPRTAQPKRR